MSMGFMVAAASRKRDDRGRYMEAPDRRMDGGYERPEGNYSRMNDGPEMRRRRDERGRYMEGDERPRMAYEGNQGNYVRMEQGGASSHYWPEPHIPPYLDKPGMNRRMDTGGSRMHEEPDGQNPYGGEPEVYRRQHEGSSPDMRRMNEGKTSGGEINYNRADGGYGNVRYFMHKTDPLNQHDGKERMETMEHPRQIGFQSNDHEDGLDKQTVMEWVEEMEDSEGVKGGKYTWHQAQQYAMNKGITGQQRQLEFYWAMNAMYADFHEAGKKFGVDKPDFYACLAKLFIEDPDAVDNKVEEYYRHIVKHDT